MKKLIFILSVLVVCSVSSAFQGATLTDLQLLNPQLSAGEKLHLQFRAQTNPGKQILLTTGTTIYLGFIVQNIFPQSESMNRQSQNLGNDLFEVSDLIVNPWAAPDRKYGVVEFCVMTTDGHSTCLEQRSDNFYWQFDPQDTNAKPLLTKIPIIFFSVNPNPNADNVGPEIQSISADKPFYHAGEEIHFQVKATDNLSGIPDNAFGYFCPETFLFDNGGFFSVTANTDSTFVTNENSPIHILSTAKPGKYIITNVGIMDRAKNYGMLLRLHDNDTTYSRNGALTNIPLMTIEVR